MALTALTTSMLLPLIKPGARVAACGYPDMIAPLDLMERLLGVRFGALKYRPDSDRICKRHGLKPRRIPDAQSVFGMLEAKLDVFDIVQERGDEILCDLNEPMFELKATEPIELVERYQSYDFVLDVGTLEHCFNIGQAAKNMVGLLKAGGIIFHGNPHCSGNHGFYGLQPTWYADFYGQDGFELLYCKLMVHGSDEPLDVPLTARFSFGAPEVNIFATARRNEIKPIIYPQQTKYKGSAAWQLA